ncbi:2,5-diamino-6-(ribosylamino)-4(3H)-pyrimidinone 5'-phosphate reductase [Methanothrix sp.]|uniref:2,5-diamino-6-(ribosylamino)-4(3H)-pyrimidinone 5'-phosphate reductase n=1 Tax=Methanothrix sp. TaxID=90426 RepID=UPI003C745564
MRRPFVFINSAMSADGKISSIDRKQIRISGRDDLTRVDELRASSDAIMVGVGTVLADDPGLRIKSRPLQERRKDMGLDEEPLRIVADSNARTPANAKVLGARCLIAVSRSAPEERRAGLRSRCEMIECGAEMVDLSELMGVLYDRGINRLMVEGGARLNWSLIELGLVDEIYVFIGGLIIGGERAPSLVDGSGFRSSFPRISLLSAQRMDEGILLQWSFDRNRKVQQ